MAPASWHRRDCSVVQWGGHGTLPLHLGALWDLRAGHKSPSLVPGSEPVTALQTGVTSRPSLSTESWTGFISSSGMHLQGKGWQKTLRPPSGEMPQGSASHLDQTGRGTGIRGGTPASGVGPGKACVCPCCHVPVPYSSLRREHRGSAQPTRGRPGRPGRALWGRGRGHGGASGPLSLVPPFVLLNRSRLTLPSLSLSPRQGPSLSLSAPPACDPPQPLPLPLRASSSFSVPGAPHTHTTQYVYIYTTHMHT